MENNLLIAGNRYIPERKNRFFGFLNSRDFPYILVIPFLIYVYFLQWKPSSIHDDDLFLYRAFAHLNGFSEQTNVSLYFGQYRPVRDIFFYAFMKIFNNNLEAIYIFNVIIQAINTIIFAYLLNLFLKSFRLSLFLSLILCLSRFCFYNVIQIWDGGILEGMAMTFFLLFLFFIVRAAIDPGRQGSKQSKDVIWSIVFANLSMYTHERYIAIFPFILLMILFFPGFKQITFKRKLFLSSLALGSVILNIALKSYVYHVKFLVGTGNTKIEFSISSAFQFLAEGVSTIFQYSIGPEWLVGYQFSELPVFYQILVYLIIGVMLLVFGLYIGKMISGLISKYKPYPPYTAIFIFLPTLFFLMLVPCIFQHRIELRWLQASLTIAILIFIIALIVITKENIKRRNFLAILIGVCFLMTNHYYNYNGSNNLYYSTSARIGDAFHEAIADSSIHLGPSNLYIFEQTRNEQRESELKWALVDGWFFAPYNGTPKNLIFLDSAGSIKDFNVRRDDLIHLDIIRDGLSFKYVINNIARDYLRDSLHEFTQSKGGKYFLNNIHYDQDQLAINNETFPDFITEGFYDNENGSRWTNGSASIGFIGDFVADDSVNMELNTYMPPVSKNVTITPMLIDVNGKEYKPVFSRREADNFHFKFDFQTPVKISSIRLLSDTIPVSPPDTRKLSFLFGGMKLKN